MGHFNKIFFVLAGLLVHRGVRPVQGEQRGQGLRRRAAVGVRRAAARHQRQARAPRVRAGQHGRPALPGPGVPADLLRRRELRGRQGEVPALGVDHVAAVRGALQPTHRARRGARLRRQARHPGVTAQHRNPAPDERDRQAATTVLLRKKKQIKMEKR